MWTTTKWIPGALIVLACTLLASGCASGADRIDNLLDTLPTPLDVELVYQASGEGQGSQDSCYFPYTKQLYGTNRSFEDVVAFYERSLDQTTWQPRSDGLVPRNSPSWETTSGDFWLSVRPDPRLDFPEDVVQEAQSRYRTIYFITVTYIDKIARTKCLGVKD